MVSCGEERADADKPSRVKGRKAYARERLRAAREKLEMGRGLLSEMMRVSSDASPAVANLLRAGLAIDGYRVDAKADWREISSAHEERDVISTLLAIPDNTPQIAAVS